MIAWLKHLVGSTTTMWEIINVLCGIILIRATLSESAVQAPVVSTCSGDVRGMWMMAENNRNIEAYLGMPYAKPPVGDCRFRDPEPFGKWPGVMNGSKEANKCLQMNIFAPGTIDGSEDCLQLSVYTPSSAVKGKYPVLIFIHGGSFINGYASSDTYGPDKLLTRDVVLVTPNYRLGFLGYASFNHPEFSGNYGLKDISLALKWVKRNIANFGGNDSCITLAGQSSGAASVHYQVLSPQNEGLFHRAILLSGTADCPWAVSTRFQNANITAKMANLVNCSQTTALEILKCLRSVNASKFLMNYANFQTVWYEIPQAPFPPCLESSDNKMAFITEKSYKTRSSSIPIMIGAMSSEGTLDIAMLKADTGNHFEEALSELDKKFEPVIAIEAGFEGNVPNPKERAAQLKKKYFGKLPVSSETLQKLTDLYSDIYYLNGISFTIKGLCQETYLYKFGFEGSFSVSQLLSGDPNYRNGACHGDDLLYLFPLKPFNILRKNESEKDRAMSIKMIDFIVNFVTNGNPNSMTEAKKWCPSSGRLDYLSIDSQGNFEMRTNFPDNRIHN